MIRLINKSSLFEVHKLTENEDSYYYTIGKMLAIFNMSDSISEKLIEKIDSKELDKCEVIAFYLYDKYFDKDKICSGFTKFFKHLIFKNQWFLNHDIVIFCISDEMKSSIEEVITNTQRIITKTGELWPTTDEQFIEILDVNQSAEGSMLISTGNKSPYRTFKYNTSPISKKISNFYEVSSIEKTFKTKTNPCNDEIVSSNGYSKPKEEFENFTDRTSPEDGFYYFKLYKINKYKCNVITMDTKVEIAKFYGGGLSKTDMKADKELRIYIIDPEPDDKFKIYLSEDTKEQFIEFLERRGDYFNE